MDDLKIFHGLYKLFETVNLSLDCSSSYKHKSFLFKMMAVITFNTIILDVLEYSFFLRIFNALVPLWVSFSRSS